MALTNILNEKILSEEVRINASYFLLQVSKVSDNVGIESETAYLLLAILPLQITLESECVRHNTLMKFQQLV